MNVEPGQSVTAHSFNELPPPKKKKKVAARGRNRLTNRQPRKVANTSKLKKRVGQCRNNRQMSESTDSDHSDNLSLFSDIGEYLLIYEDFFIFNECV